MEENDEEWEDESDEEEDEDEAEDALYAELGPDEFYCQEIILKNLPSGEGLPKEVRVGTSIDLLLFCPAYLQRLQCLRRHEPQNNLPPCMIYAYTASFVESCARSD